VSKFRVARGCNNFRVNLSEILGFFTELNDFRWTDEGEIQRVEKEHQPFASIVRKFEGLELGTNQGVALKSRSFGTNMSVVMCMMMIIAVEADLSGVQSWYQRWFS